MNRYRDSLSVGDAARLSELLAVLLLAGFFSPSLSPSLRLVLSVSVCLSVFLSGRMANRAAAYQSVRGMGGERERERERVESRNCKWCRVSARTLRGCLHALSGPLMRLGAFVHGMFRAEATRRRQPSTRYPRSSRMICGR